MTISQQVEFKGIRAAQMYDMFLSPIHHSKIRGGVNAEISKVEGTDWSIEDGHISGKILRLIEGRLIVLSWRSIKGKPEEIEQVVILNFEQSGDNTRIELTHANLPDYRYETVQSNWNERYWEPWKRYLLERTL